MLKIIKALRRRLTNFSSEKPVNFLASYAQCGEDLILQYLFKEFGILKPTYIDVGANHPTNLSNTYLFYLNGSTGVNIEPDPELISPFTIGRKNDVNLNIGIGLQGEDILDFYVMSNRVLNTFSKEEAERVAGYGSFKIDAVRKIKVIPLQSVIDTHFAAERPPDLISIDVEGLDYEIVKSLDLRQYPRTVFCVETINYTEDNTERKHVEIFNYFQESGFFVYADTYLNTIFVNRDYWTSRRKT